MADDQNRLLLLLLFPILFKETHCDWASTVPQVLTGEPAETILTKKSMGGIMGVHTAP